MCAQNSNQTSQAHFSFLFSKLKKHLYWFAAKHRTHIQVHIQKSASRSSLSHMLLSCFTRHLYVPIHTKWLDGQTNPRCVLFVTSFLEFCVCFELATKNRFILGWDSSEFLTDDVEWNELSICYGCFCNKINIFHITSILVQMVHISFLSYVRSNNLDHLVPEDRSGNLKPKNKNGYAVSVDFLVKV